MNSLSGIPKCNVSKEELHILIDNNNDNVVAFYLDCNIPHKYQMHSGQR